MWYARPPMVSSKRCTVTVLDSWVGEKRVEFYAGPRRDQAKGMTKGASTWVHDAVRADSTERKFKVVRFSTGFAPFMHRFSTAALSFSPAASRRVTRSEERRVGKECR